MWTQLTTSEEFFVVVYQFYAKLCTSMRTSIFLTLSTEVPPAAPREAVGDTAAEDDEYRFFEGYIRILRNISSYGAERTVIT